MISAHAPALVDYIFLIEEFPFPGGHARIISTSKSPGGAGANVVHNLATLGLETRLYTTMGRDEDARFFIENTKAKIFAEVTDELTGKVYVFVDKKGERTFFVQPNAAGKPFVKVKSDEFLYVDPFPTEISFEVQKEIMESFGGFIILNPGHLYVSMGFKKFSELLKLSDMVIMSSAEFKILRCSKEDLMKFVDFAVITLGERGAVCWTKKEKFMEKAFKAKVVDTTGAGDAFAAGFIYGFINGLPIDVCLKLGNFCGAYNVERIGARVFPAKELVEKFLSEINK